MAERRMLAKSIVESDMFSDMPTDAQMLYIRLNMAADDDGFVDNPRVIMRSYGFSDDNMKLLVAKKFVLTFQKGDNFIYLIKHWKVNNYIRTDRYHESKYKQMLRDVYYDENSAYTMNPEGSKPCLPCGNQVVDNRDTEYGETEVRLGKDRIGKDSLELEIDKDIDRTVEDRRLPTPRELDISIWNDRVVKAIEDGRLIDAKRYASSAFNLYGVQIDIEALVKEHSHEGYQMGLH